MLQPGNDGNNMLSFSFLYCVIFFFTHCTCPIFSLLLKILEFLLFFSSIIIVEVLITILQFFHLCFQAEELLELMQLLLCPHCASKWMLALVLFGLKLLINQNHTRDSYDSSASF